MFFLAGKYMIKKINRIRYSTIFFGLFIALLLYQPEGYGTFAAMGSMIAVVLSCIFQRNIHIKRFIFPLESKILILFLILSIFTTYLRLYTFVGIYKYVSQILFFLILQNISLKEKEHSFIKWVFILSTCLYAIEAIRYCIINQSIRYVHDDIVIFGATFDPNFVGLTFVMSYILLFDNILRNKNRLISFFGIFLLLIAIIYTSSRGNFVGLVIGTLLVVISFLKDKKIKIKFKVISIVLVIIVLLFIINYFSTMLSIQWSRMAVVSTYEDNGRFTLWLESIQLFKLHPLIGNGVHSMYYIYGKASHNTYLQILVVNGIIGFLLMGIFLFLLYKKVKRYEKILSIAFITLLIQIFFLDAFDNRCVWAILCWISMLPMRREDK